LRCAWLRLKSAHGWEFARCGWCALRAVAAITTQRAVRRSMARRAALPLLLALAASAYASAVAAAVQAAAAPAFAVPPGYASFNDYCVRHLATLSDAALDELYANSTSASGTSASGGSGDASQAAPRGCVPGCILPGHGSSVFAPTLRGAAPRPRCCARCTRCARESNIRCAWCRVGR
jgi:hypothetical protein